MVIDGMECITMLKILGEVAKRIASQRNLNSSRLKHIQAMICRIFHTLNPWEMVQHMNLLTVQQASKFIGKMRSVNVRRYREDFIIKMLIALQDFHRKTLKTLALDDKNIQRTKKGKVSAFIIDKVKEILCTLPSPWWFAIGLPENAVKDFIAARRWKGIGCLLINGAINYEHDICNIRDWHDLDAKINIFHEFYVAKRNALNVDYVTRSIPLEFSDEEQERMVIPICRLMEYFFGKNTNFPMIQSYIDYAISFPARENLLGRDFPYFLSRNILIACSQVRRKDNFTTIQKVIDYTDKMITKLFWRDFCDNNTAFFSEYADPLQMLRISPRIPQDVVLMFPEEILNSMISNDIPRENLEVTVTFLRHFWHLYSKKFMGNNIQKLYDNLKSSIEDMFCEGKFSLEKVNEDFREGILSLRNLQFLFQLLLSREQLLEGLMYLDANVAMHIPKDFYENLKPTDHKALQPLLHLHQKLLECPLQGDVVTQEKCAIIKEKINAMLSNCHTWDVQCIVDLQNGKFGDQYRSLVMQSLTVEQIMCAMDQLNPAWLQEISKKTLCEQEEFRNIETLVKLMSIVMKFDEDSSLTEIRSAIQYHAENLPTNYGKFPTTTEEGRKYFTTNLLNLIQYLKEHTDCNSKIGSEILQQLKENGKNIFTSYAIGFDAVLALESHSLVNYINMLDIHAIANFCEYFLAESKHNSEALRCLAMIDDYEALKCEHLDVYNKIKEFCETAIDPNNPQDNTQKYINMMDVTTQLAEFIDFLPQSRIELSFKEAPLSLDDLHISLNCLVSIEKIITKLCNADLMEEKLLYFFKRNDIELAALLDFPDNIIFKELAPRFCRLLTFSSTLFTAKFLSHLSSLPENSSIFNSIDLKVLIKIARVTLNKPAILLQYDKLIDRINKRIAESINDMSIEDFAKITCCLTKSEIENYLLKFNEGQNYDIKKVYSLLNSIYESLFLVYPSGIMRNSKIILLIKLHELRDIANELLGRVDDPLWQSEFHSLVEKIDASIAKNEKCDTPFPQEELEEEELEEEEEEEEEEAKEKEEQKEEPKPILSQGKDEPQGGNSVSAEATQRGNKFIFITIVPLCAAITTAITAIFPSAAAIVLSKVILFCGFSVTSASLFCFALAIGLCIGTIIAFLYFLLRKRSDEWHTPPQEDQA
jgi:hypothetical protein